jgi:hypothetical protein
MEKWNAKLSCRFSHGRSSLDIDSVSKVRLTFRLVDGSISRSGNDHIRPRFDDRPNDWAGIASQVEFRTAQGNKLVARDPCAFRKGRHDLPLASCGDNPHG